MDDIVNASFGRQAEAVCQCTNALNHFIRPKILWPELGLVTGTDSGCCTLIQAEPHPISHLKLDHSLVSIM